MSEEMDEATYQKRLASAMAQDWDRVKYGYLIKGHIDCLRATIAQQGAVIAAMRDVLEGSAYLLARHPTEFSMQKICPQCDQWQGKHEPECQVGIALHDAVQLAADHDAAIRKPLEARIRELEEAINARNR